MTTAAVRLQSGTASSAAGSFAFLEEEVGRARTGLRDKLLQLPRPFGVMAWERYSARLARAGDRPMLGEYAPFLLGEVLAASEAAIAPFVLPWLVLYAHALLLDDAVDRGGRSQQIDFATSHVLLDSALDLWKPHFERYEGLWEIFRRARAESLKALLEEETVIWNAPEACPDSPLSGRDSAISSLGNRAALVKLLAASLSFAARLRPLDSEEESGLNSLCTGVQLLDDVTDCIEDLESGRYSYVLRLALQRLHLHPKFNDEVWAKIGTDRLHAVLVLSGAMGDVAQLASEKLTQGLTGLGVDPGSLTGLLFSRMANRSARAAEECRALIPEGGVPLDDIWLHLDPGLAPTPEISRRISHHDLGVRIARCVASLPTASN